jgi:alkylation response protein AidB-like acyl-CoA dehydrogenase
VDAKLRLDQARLLAQNAARLADEHKPFSTEAAMAKLAASEAAWFATWAASQTLAGAGLRPRPAGPEVAARRQARRDLGRGRATSRGS